MELRIVQLMHLTQLGTAGYKTNRMSASVKHIEASSLPGTSLDVIMNEFVLTRPIV